MKIFSALAVKEVVEPASKAFTQETGEPVESFYGPVGTVVGKIEGGESADLTILIPPALAKLQEKGLVTGRFDLGRVGIGVAIKEGAAKPDFATPEAFKAMLLNARSIAL